MFPFWLSIDILIAVLLVTENAKVSTADNVSCFNNLHGDHANSHDIFSPLNSATIVIQLLSTIETTPISIVCAKTVIKLSMGGGPSRMSPQMMAHRRFMKRQQERIEEIQDEYEAAVNTFCTREPEKTHPLDKGTIEKFVKTSRLYDDVFSAAAQVFKTDCVDAGYVTVVPCDDSCRFHRYLFIGDNAKFWHSYPRVNPSVAIVFNVGAVEVHSGTVRGVPSVDHQSSNGMKIEGTTEFLGLDESSWVTIAEDSDIPFDGLWSFEAEEKKVFRAVKITMGTDNSLSTLAIRQFSLCGRVMLDIPESA